MSSSSVSSVQAAYFDHIVSPSSVLPVSRHAPEKHYEMPFDGRSRSVLRCLYVLVFGTFFVLLFFLSFPECLVCDPLS